MPDEIIPAAPAPATPAAPAAPAAPTPPASAADALGVAPTPPAAPVAKPMPAKDAPQSEWVKYYELPVPEGQDTKFAEKAVGWMAKAGATPEVAKALATEWNAHVAEMTKAQTDKTTKDATDAATAKSAQVAREESALNNEWGQDAEKNRGVASRAYTEFFKPFAGDKLPQLVTAIEDHIGYGATMKMMHALGQKIGEASPRGLGDGTGAAAPKTGHMEAALNEKISAALGPRK